MRNQRMFMTGRYSTSYFSVIGGVAEVKRPEEKLATLAPWFCIAASNIPRGMPLGTPSSGFVSDPSSD